MVFYFTYWFPDRYRGRAIAALFFAQPIANALGNAISGLILGMDGILGLRGWQWVFILEALPAVILAFVVLFAMIDRPALAAWLRPDERAWLETELESERRKIEGRERLSLWKALADPRVFALAMIYLTSSTASYGTTFFMPQIVKGLGLSNTMTGLVSAVPFLVGMAGLVIWGWSSDKSGERRWHLISASVVGFIGLAGAGVFGSSYWALAAMSLAILGIYGSRTSFWPLPSQFLVDGSGGRHRLHQRHRQSRRLFRPLRRGLDQGRDQELRDGPLFPRALLARLGRDHLLRPARGRRTKLRDDDQASGPPHRVSERATGVFFPLAAPLTLRFC